jgi:trimeric autotransporter adhesin
MAWQQQLHSLKIKFFFTKKQLTIMKAFMKMSAVLLLALLTQTVFAQTAASGDYRSVASGNWQSTSTWQVRDGSGNWTTPSAAPTSSNNVYVQSGHIVVVDATIATCRDLHLQAIDSLAIGNNTLEVSGKIRSYNSFQITTGALTSNVATITTAVAHGLSAGSTVIIHGLGTTLTPLNGTFTIASVPTTTTFTYNLTNANITSTTGGTTTGSVTRSGIVVTGSTDGTFYSAQNNSTVVNGRMCASNAGIGSLKFVGSKRSIAVSGEWTANSVNFPVDVNFALINTTDTAFLTSVFGGRSMTVSSGVLSATTRLTPSGGGAGTGTFTIKTGAAFVSSATGSTQILARTSTSTFGTFTIEAGGTLEVIGSSSAIDAKTIVNNGTVILSRTSSQGLLAKGGSTDVSPNNSADFTSYNNLILRGSGAKTIPANLTVNISGTLTLGGSSSAILANGGSSVLTYSNGATLQLAGTANIGLTVSSLEWPATNGPTNITVNSNTLSFTASAGLSRMVNGTFTLNGGNFTTNTGNTLTFGNGFYYSKRW